MTDADTVVTELAGVGPQSPATTTPDRAPGSVRRTSSIDVARFDGFESPPRVFGRARDLATDADGRARVIEARTLRAELTPTLELAAIASDPAEPRLEQLVGRHVASGFRRAVVEVLSDARAAANLLYLLLDDLPVATLVSGYALQRAGLVPSVPVEHYAPTVDLCAGWASGGTLMQVLNARGTVPMTLGPVAPVLERDDDPDVWHDLPDPVARMVRRRRRIDLTIGEGLRIDAIFRDSHFDDEVRETVVHEYALYASIDRTTLEIITAVAEPHVLPYVECPTAASSASRLVGLRLDELRDRVRAEFVGTSTCTHLNDLLRSLEDVRGMLPETR